jgi:hypothetical protein
MDKYLSKKKIFKKVLEKTKKNKGEHKFSELFSFVTIKKFFGHLFFWTFILELFY